MEDYNSEALRTVEDIANNIPMDINRDIYKNNESPNEIPSKLTDTYNESINSAGRLSSANSVRSELESEVSNVIAEAANESAFMPNNDNGALEGGSTNVESVLDNVSTASDNIQNILNTESEVTNSNENLTEKMNWTPHESDLSVSNDITASDNVTSDTSFASKDTVEEPIENECTEKLHSENSFKDDNNLHVSTYSTENTIDNDTSDSTQYEKQSDRPESSDTSEKPPMSNNIDELFSEDKDTSDHSTGLTMLEDLSEIPSESYPELEHGTEKTLTESSLSTAELELQANRESQSEDLDTHSESTERNMSSRFDSEEVDKENSSQEIPEQDTDKTDSTENTTTETPMEISSTETPFEKSSSDVPVEASSTEAPVEGSNTEAPVKEITTEAPVEEASTEASVEGIGIEASAESNTTEAPLGERNTETSLETNGTDTDTPMETSSTEIPVDNSSTETSPEKATNDTPSEKTTGESFMETSTTETSIENEDKNKDKLSDHLSISNKDKQGDRENTEFVQVNEKEGEDGDKDGSSEQRRDIEHDPIASDTFESLNNEDREGADEELCIIPDTTREISQEERDAASSIPPLRDISESTITSQSDNNLDEASRSSVSPVTVFTYDKDDMQTCTECKQNRKVKYLYFLKGEKEEKFICNDTCLTTYQNTHCDKVGLGGNIRVKHFSEVNKEPPSLSFIRKCAGCNKETNNSDENLTWEIMDFCNEFCLTKYQKEIGSHCSSCKGSVNASSLGKYCVRFGNDVRQFCTSICLEKYKKGLKVCSYCQQDMSAGGDGFLAPVGDKGQFKDFCSQVCMEKYDIMTNGRPPKVDAGTLCSVCKTEKTITIEFELNGNQNYFCGEPCFVAFSFVNKISPGKCAMCRRHFPKSVLEKHTMYYDNVQHSFCSTSCENIYIIAHRRIVPCSWCKVKKYNFDMIRRFSTKEPMINMCSVNCLTLHKKSTEEVNVSSCYCSSCQKIARPLYHLSMSDSTVRNFCSYNCVLNYQNTYPKNDSYPVPTGPPRRNKQFPETAASVTDVNQLPVISSVQSLATNGSLTPSTVPSLTPITTRSTRSKASGATPVMNSNTQVINSFSDIPFQVQIKQHFIVRPAPIAEQRNVGTMCYTRKINKGITAKPGVVDQEVQTDEREAQKILIPVPVPIYVPTPMHMYSVPTPVPVPIPLPVPIPIFIPTTRNSAAGIMKEIKKIQVKIPTDPYEAELLMMAEMVAEEKKEDITDSESEVDDAGGPEDSYSPEPVDSSNTFGDDMLQMALKMATELDEPAVDLEGALTANTITAPQGGEPHPVTGEENVDDPQQPMHHHMNPAVRGRKRGMRQPRGGAKRGRRMSHHQVDMPMMQHHQVQQPPPPPEPVEKPDANMCLKYTFGVNAWKQWVTTKNAELEKSSRLVGLVKLFKTEILQLTSDELNYSLCLFVKEVRKPNGAEYAPDTIYYLCLGIQQYLFENGRIDNIFCDTYYEKFTDCLDEVAKKFSVLYNDSHYIVTRVEEEHLWESKQLGAHSPHVLLSTLMFFNTKHFNLTSVDEHMQLSFSHIMKHWKRNPNQPGASKVPGSRNVLLRFYPPQSAIQNNARKKKVYEQQENEENPLRCPVKLYEFYLSKCPESVKTRNDVFYLQPERSCVPDSPVWYSTMPLPKESLEKMLHRVKMVKEINVALLTS